MARPPKFTHGRNGYERYGCRCAVCRAAIAAHQRDFQAKNREKMREKDRNRYAENPEKYKTRVRLWALKNPDVVRTKAREYMRKRLATDMSFRLLNSLRRRVRQAIRRGDKAARTAELIGCSTSELMKHIESKFTEGMSWENYGEWHIDHIRPCASFDLSNEEQQKSCFNWSNLQPLWAKDNHRKNSMWDGKLLRKNT